MNERLIAFMAKGPGCDKNRGQFNGYVGIRKDIPCIESFMTDLLKYRYDENEDLLDKHISIHGGITLDIPAGHFILPRNKIYPITRIPEDIHKNYRILGFDTNHVDDDCFIWTYDTVREETKNFYNQIKEYLKL